MTGAHCCSYLVLHSWSNSLEHSSSWIVSWTVLGSLAILLVLEAALLTGDSFLDRPLGDLAFALLDISTDSISDVMALPPGDGVIHGLGNLLADLLGERHTGSGA